jgi:hypothetical protein
LSSIHAELFDRLTLCSGQACCIVKKSLALRLVYPMCLLRLDAEESSPDRE